MVAKTDEEKEKLKPGEQPPPIDTDFVQQKIKGFKPSYTPHSVFWALVIMALVPLCVGIFFYNVVDNLKEVKYDYSANDPATMTCTDSQGDQAKPANWPLPGATEKFRDCEVTITIPEDMEAPVSLYFRLDKMLQSHRRYTLSRVDDQFTGEFKEDETYSDTKKEILINYENPNTKKTYYPGGLYPLSFFTDEFYNLRHTPEGGTENAITLTETGLVDHQKDQSGEDVWDNPPFYTDYHADKANAHKKFSFLEETFPFYRPFSDPKQEKGVKNEHFKVWMRPSAQTGRRKLYGHILEEGQGVLKKGTLKLSVKDRWDVSSYQGKKEIIITELSKIGGKNQTGSSLLFTIAGFTALVSVYVGYLSFINPRPIGHVDALQKRKDGSVILL